MGRRRPSPRERPVRTPPLSSHHRTRRRRPSLTALAPALAPPLSIGFKYALVFDLEDVQEKLSREQRGTYIVDTGVLLPALRYTM